MINLLPPAIKEDRIFGKRNRILVGYAIAFVVTAILVILIMLISLRFVSADKNTITKSINENETLINSLKSDTSELNKIVKRLSVTHELFKDTVSFSELIPQIGSLLPEGTIINGLELTGGITDPLALTVRMNNPNLAPVVQKNLVESEIFEAADIITLNVGGQSDDGADQSLSNTYPSEATISVSFTGSAEAKKKEAAEAAAKAEAEAQAAQEEAESN